MVFIAVGTPPDSNGRADLSFVEKVSRDIAHGLDKYTVVVEKSTVPVRTGSRVRQTIEREVRPGIEFDVASNPEFLREGQAIQDFLHPDRIVIGVSSERAAAVLRRLYAPIPAPIIQTDIESAELIKHASNSFLATKISFVNAVARICELSGANIVDVARGLGLDQRIGPSFLAAGIGYGGSCFPKDVDAFYEISRELGYEFRLLRDVQEINRTQRAHFIKRIENALWVVKDKKVAVLGLSFKPNTDDMREAPSVDIIRWLVDCGAAVTAHDPKSIEVARRLLPAGIAFAPDPYACVEGAECVVLVTEWDVYRSLDLKRVRETMRRPLFLDGRNLFDPSTMVDLGFEYHSIGRK